MAAAMIVGATSACLDDVTGTRPLSIALSADNTTPAVGEDVTISWVATGTDLGRVIIEFGDLTADTTDYNLLPLEVGGQVTHAYTAAGSYTVRGTALALIGTISDELTITVN